MVPGQVRARSRYEPNQALEQLVGRESERRGTVTPRPLEPQLEPPIVELGQAISGDRGASEVPRHALEPISIVGGDPRGGLQVVPFDLRAEPPHHDGVDVLDNATNADNAAAAARAGGNPAAG
jgi:hypothetical protein